MEVFVGLDWAEEHHDVFVEDEAGQRLAGARLPEGMEGIRRFHELVAAYVDDPGQVLVATETDRGLFIGALVGAGYRVLAVNPMSVARYRERHVTSGAKSDPGDAKVLADLARTDAHNHRLVAGDTDLGEAIKVLARSHQSLIWTRQRQSNQLRSTLREFYPGALDAFDDLTGRDAFGRAGHRPHPRSGPPAVPSQDRLRPAARGTATPDRSTSSRDPGRSARRAPPSRPARGRGHGRHRDRPGRRDRSGSDPDPGPGNRAGRPF